MRHAKPEDRIRELTAELETERKRLRAVERRIKLMERSIDFIAGMDQPGWEAAGRAQEQERAAAPAPGPAACPPSGRLPRREPGLADGGERP